MITYDHSLFITLVKTGATNKELAKVFGASTGWVYKKKKEHNLTSFLGCNPNSRGNACRNKNKTINQVFSIVSPLSSYWAGYIAADGNVHNNTVRVVCHQKDREHLGLLRQFTGRTKLFDYIHNRGYSNNSPMTALTIHSKQISMDLKTHYNIVPNKSLILQPPSLSIGLALCYLVGYIDGDGYIKRGVWGAVLGTSAFLQWANIILDNHSQVKPHHSVFRLYLRKATVQRLRDTAEQYCLPVLRRKWYA